MFTARHVHWLRFLAAGMLGALLVAGCTRDGSLPDPRPTDDPARAAGELASALANKDLTPVEFVGRAGAEVNELFGPLVAGMGPLEPEVSVAGIDRRDDEATARLQVSWTFPGVPTSWSYASTAVLRTDAGRWKTGWQPSILHPRLDGSNRLSQQRLAAPRGELLGEDDDPIVKLRPVVRIGIDKSQVKGAAAQSSARQLARLLDIDPARYADQVADAGPEAFVEAIVLRAEAEERPANKEVYAIPGALPIQDEQMLAPTREFARPVLGTVGETTAEIVRESSGSVVAGDQVGLSGLQRRYDAQMRGTPGAEVRLLRTVRDASASATPSASSAPTPSPKPEPVTVFQADPVAGKDLRTTLNPYLQRLAERTLSEVRPASALVAIRPSTGEVLAAANNAATKGQSIATVGQAAPGSTFKVATSLALLRVGMQASSRVRCPVTLTVDGRRFKNYSDYPSSEQGSITLQTALAQSCNTAFIGQRGKVDDDGLAQAAGSLGLGLDYDVGYSSFFGSVPAAKSETGHAAAMIGQGTVLASPLSMAAVAASVSAGKTVIPALITDTKVPSKAEPLTAAEASALRDMMGAVVTEGSGRFLADLSGPQVLAKTGTAEYGSEEPPRTHAWMIASQGDLAVAVFVHDGESGSKTAGPILEDFLDGSR